MQNVTVDREKYIGGSDIPIIMGISSFKSRYDLLLEKAELKENTFKGNEYTEYGNVMEEKIRNCINKSEEKPFEEYKKINGDIRCHLDGYNGDTVLEIKTTSHLYNDIQDYKVYLSQLLFYMDNVGAENGLLAVYERPDDFNQEFDSNRLTLWGIEKKNYTELLEQVNSSVEQFRKDLARIKENPFLTEEDLMPTDLTILSNQVLEIESQLAAYDELAKKRDMLKEQLRQAMLEHDVKKWTTPNNIQITVVADGADKEVKKFNEKKFAEEQADLYSQYSETKVQKGRKGYLKITLPKE